uniref:Immunoglobulin domain-containing protein n=1 Tax=Terrapene triunguis TaxID=2587831 RepID=A0A674K2I9_9SAUR
MAVCKPLITGKGVWTSCLCLFPGYTQRIQGAWGKAILGAPSIKKSCNTIEYYILMGAPVGPRANCPTCPPLWAVLATPLPTGVTAPGAEVTIQCQGQRRDVRFFLHKAGDLNPQRNMDPAGDGAEFRIPTVGRQHGGSYSCSYRPQSEPFVSSQPSDPVELVVAEPTLPKPSVSIRPSQGVALGGAATIRCQAQLQNATFLLYKDGGYWGQAAPVEDVAEFPVTGAGWRDPGSYRCSYHTTREPVAMSHPSDPAQLVVRGEGPRSVSPSHSAPGPRQQGGRGEDPLGQLNGLRLGLRFHLYKAGDGNYLTYTDPAGSEAEFPLTSVRWEHGGSYTCRYTYRAGGVAYSEPSDPVQIIVAGEGPIPASRLQAPHPAGADVTIRCQGQRRDVRFFLHKAGDLNLQRHMDPAGDGAEFRIPTVDRQHGGSYSCSYRLQSEPFISSQPSDPMQLVVAGEGPHGMLRARLCPESWAQQRGRPAGEAGTESLWGFPSQGGEAATGDLGQRKGGSLPPGGLQGRGAFPRHTSVRGDGLS